MANKKREEDWARAKRLCRLNAETVRMAKELGLNPRKLTKHIPNKSQPWKAPVREWIRDMYAAMKEKSARKKARREVGETTPGQESSTEHAAEMPPLVEDTFLSGDEEVLTPYDIPDYSCSAPVEDGPAR